MGRRGRKRQLDLESEYWKLLQSGVGTVAACKLLGIGRKTGYRWRAENGGLPPARLAESARSGRYLSLLERQRIATLRDRGLGVREIARRLGRSPSTISRELRRHLRPHDRGIYDGDLAHARARERSRRPRRPLLAREPELRQVVQDLLERGVEPGADRGASARDLPGPAGMASVPRDDLPGPLPRRKRRPEQDVDQEAAHRTTAAQAPAHPDGAHAQVRHVNQSALITPSPAATHVLPGGGVDQLERLSLAPRQAANTTLPYVPRGFGRRAEHLLLPDQSRRRG